jgi:regulator of nonsense transcripts 2
MEGGDNKSLSSNNQPSQPTPSSKRASLRLANLNPSAPLASNSLDSSLKKNTAFIKRLKTGLHANENVQALIKETGTLSLDKYLSEISIALNEGLAKCKSAPEIWGAIEVSTSMNTPSLCQPY